MKHPGYTLLLTLENYISHHCRPDKMYDHHPTNKMADHHLHPIHLWPVDETQEMSPDSKLLDCDQVHVFLMN